MCICLKVYTTANLYSIQKSTRAIKFCMLDRVTYNAYTQVVNMTHLIKNPDFAVFGRFRYTVSIIVEQYSFFLKHEG